MTPIDDIDEQTRNEENTKLKYITPELVKKWSAEGDQIVMEYGKTAFTDGQILVNSDGVVIRGERKKVDYLLLYKYNTILPLIDSMAVYGTKKKTGRPKQEEALSFISSLLGTQKSSDSKPAAPEITELKAKAKEELPAIVKKYASLMGVTYNRITIRHQKTCWGSCTKTGNLSFNCLLMKMPENVRDYVIIHELAHRKELNHSSKFWTIVAEYCPWYKESKQWLKDNGQGLMER